MANDRSSLDENEKIGTPAGDDVVDMETDEFDDEDDAEEDDSESTE